MGYILSFRPHRGLTELASTQFTAQLQSERTSPFDNIIQPETCNAGTIHMGLGRPRGREDRSLQVGQERGLVAQRREWLGSNKVRSLSFLSLHQLLKISEVETH